MFFRIVFNFSDLAHSRLLVQEFNGDLIGFQAGNASPGQEPVEIDLVAARKVSRGDLI
jgi:hypothetical protein